MALQALQINQAFDLLRADARVRHPDSPQNRAAAAARPSPRVVVTFGTSHPDACAVFCENDFYQTPGTLPLELEAKFRRGEIPLDTLSLVSIGPGNTYLVVSGTRAWWDLSGLDPLTQNELRADLMQMAEAVDDQNYGFNGIVSCSFGLRGETCLIYNYGRNAWASDHPPLEQDVMGHIQRTFNAPGGGLKYAAFGPRGAAILQPLARQLPDFWSHRQHWPTREMAREMHTILGQPPIFKIQSSVVNPEHYYIIRSGVGGSRTILKAPADIVDVWNEWVNQPTANGQNRVVY